MNHLNEQQITRLRESEEKYRKMIELANDAIFAIDMTDGTILEVNPKAEELTGYSCRELVGKKVWDLHPQEELASTRKLFDDVIKTGHGHCSQMHFYRKDGTLRQIEVSASVISHGDKKVIQRICRDITDRWELQQENEFLKQYYEAILDMMPVGLGVRKDISKTPTVEFENKKLKEMFDQTNLAGCPCSWYEQDENKEICCEGATLNANGVYAEERIFPNDRVYQFTLSYFRDRVNAWRELQIVQDVTERHRLEDELQHANEDLEHKVEERTRELKQKQTQLVQAEKMASLGNLVAGIAHEINTPLGALRSNTDLFVRSIAKVNNILTDSKTADEVLENAELSKLLENIQKLNTVNEAATERIVNIVNSLRKFARLDQAEMDTYDIHEGIESTLTLVNHELKNRIEVVKDYGDIPQIYCYPNQLNQVFMNILVNASQAIEDQGTVRITTSRQDGNIVVEISDSGRGIPKKMIKRIFDPGFTTKGSGVGTGLGLSIVHQIIQDHKGRIEVESEPGKGTTFRVILPIE